MKPKRKDEATHATWFEVTGGSLPSNRFCLRDIHLAYIRDPIIPSLFRPPPYYKSLSKPSHTKASSIFCRKYPASQDDAQNQEGDNYRKGS